MAKKSRLLKRLDAEAAAETEARKQKALAEGQYSVNPDTGEPINQTPVAQEKQVIETVNTPGFENTKYIKSSGINRVLGSAGDVQQVNKDVSAAIDSGNIGKMGEFGITPKFTESQLAANLSPLTDAEKVNVLNYNDVVSQKENAEDMIKTDAGLARLNAQTPEDYQAINQAEQDLMQKTAMVGQEMIQSRKPDTFSKFEMALRQPSTDGTFDITAQDIQQGYDELDAETFYGMTPQAQEKYNILDKLVKSGRIRTSEPAIEKLGVVDYFPDINAPLAKGNYSGSIVGSNTIYTPNGAVIPWGLYDARKRALQNEALKKKQQKEKLLEMANIAAAPQYKNDLDNLDFSYVQDFIKETNGNVDRINDPNDPATAKFYKRHNTLKNLGGQTLWLQDRFNKMLELLNDPKAHITKKQEYLMNKWASGGYFNAQELLNDPKKMKELNNLYGQWNAYDNMTYYVAQNIKDLEKNISPMVADWNAQINGLPAEKQNELLAAKDSGDFRYFLELSKKYMPELRASKWSDGMFSQHKFDLGGNNEEENKAMMFEYVMSHFAEEITPKITVQKNRNLEWYKQKYKEKQDISVWEQISLKTNSENVANAIGDASKTTPDGWLDSLTKSTDGMNWKYDGKGRVYGTFQLSESEKNKRASTVGKEKLFGKNYNDFVKSIPYKYSPIDGGNVIDYDKIPSNQHAVVKYLEQNNFDPSTVVQVQTSGYRVYPEWEDQNGNKHYLTYDQAKANPTLAGRTKGVVEREGTVIIPTKKVYTVNGKDQIKEENVSAGVSWKRYDTTNPNDITELNASTKQPYISKELGQEDDYEMSNEPEGPSGETSVETISFD